MGLFEAVFGGKKEFDYPPKLYMPMYLDTFAKTQGGNLPRFSDVMGLTRYALSSAAEVISMINNPAEYEKYHQRKTEGYIFSGPPGIGKTMLVHAIVNEGGKHVRVSTIQPSMLYDENTGKISSIKVQAMIAQIKSDAVMQAKEDEKKGRGIRRLKESSNDKKTLVVVCDEVEQLVLDKTQRASGVALSYEQFGAINDMMKGFDSLKSATNNVIFLFTTNYPHIIEAAVKDRLRLVPLRKPNATVLKHLYIKGLSDRMHYLQQESGRVYSKAILDAIEAYRNASADIDAALQSGNQARLDKAKEKLREIYTQQMDDELTATVESSDGFSGRDVERVLDDATRIWIREGLAQRRGFLSRGPQPISGIELFAAANRRFDARADEETDPNERRDYLKPGL